jgi:hypothetical protein
MRGGASARRSSGALVTPIVVELRAVGGVLGGLDARPFGREAVRVEAERREEHVVGDAPGVTASSAARLAVGRRS